MTIEDPATMTWVRDDRATTKVVGRVAAPTLIISRAIEARVAPVGNSPREPLTATIRVVAEATPTHIREEITTSPAQISEEAIPTSIAKVETGPPTEEATTLTAGPAEVRTPIVEVISLDMMTDAGTIDLGMIGTTNHLEMISWHRVTNLRIWTQAEITAREKVLPDLTSLLQALYNPKLAPQLLMLKQTHQQIKLQTLR